MQQSTRSSCCCCSKGTITLLENTARKQALSHLALSHSRLLSALTQPPPHPAAKEFCICIHTAPSLALILGGFVLSCGWSGPTTTRISFDSAASAGKMFTYMADRLRPTVAIVPPVTSSTFCAFVPRTWRQRDKWGTETPWVALDYPAGNSH